MFKKRIQSDNGAYVTIIGIAVIVLILLMAIFIVDASKNLYIKNQYYQAAQRATQTAIKDQDMIGGLKKSAMNHLIDEYKIQTGRAKDDTGASLETGAFRGSCSNGKDYPKIKIYYDNKKRDNRGGTLIYTSVGFSKMPINAQDEAKFRTNQYNTIGIEVEDVAQNFFLGMFGNNCSVIKTKASATISSSHDEDKLLKEKRN